MKELTSKQILGVEMLFVIFPTTLFFMVYGSLMTAMSFSSWREIETLLGGVALLFCALAILAAWYSCIYFLRFGRADLKNFSSKWKWIVYMGGFYVMCSWLVLLLFEMEMYTSDNEFVMVFFFGLFGTPLLVPLIHLYLEWSANEDVNHDE